MKCLECNREVRNINFRHLQCCSGLTQREYLERHPNAELVDSDVRKSYGLSLNKNPNWKGGRSYRNCTFCGKRISRHNKTDRCRSCAVTGENNPFFGQKHNEETCSRMKSAAKARERSTYFPKRPTSEELSRARQNYWRRLPSKERAIRLSSFIAAGQIHNKKSSKTSIENWVAEILSGLGVIYERNIQLGRYNVDFLISQATIIECFGDYWHCNPKIYSEDYYHPSLHIKAAEKWTKDQQRLAALTALGFTCYILWERDIKSNQSLVRSKLAGIFSCK